MQNRSFAQYLSRRFFGLRFRSRSDFDREQKPWFCKAFSLYSIVLKRYLTSIIGVTSEGLTTDLLKT
ncbi:MAG TPA: hypothetical protein VKA34_00055 [Balneolales bacterium]|nr:hypothetical protein [Balneolales bacterium]